MNMKEFFWASSEELMVTATPVIVYWVYSGIYEMVLRSKIVEKYRIHSRNDEEEKNIVSKNEVVKGVLVQQTLQAAVSFFFLKLKKADKDENDYFAGDDVSLELAVPPPSWSTAALQFLVAMAVFDTWQYFMHRQMHRSRFLYRNFHSWHHRLAAPYSFGAQYNHPLDGLLTETAGGAVAYFVSGMSTRTSVVFFSFATMKGIDDHCGLMLPWNPLHIIFCNNTGFHGIHHQIAGGKCNFSQPFFVFWDKLLGTYTRYEVGERRGGGGFQDHDTITKDE